MNQRNIVLIGMPGAGKSTVGVLVAKAFGMGFVDTDLIIQQKDGRLLQEIINEDGVKPFLLIEKKVILELDVEDTVVATGGSVVYSEAAVAHLKKKGILVYLDVKFAEIERRLHNIINRGVAIGKGQGLWELYNERLPLYTKYADITVDCTDRQVEDVVARIVKRFSLA
jgi:shikimate kinase